MVLEKSFLRDLQTTFRIFCFWLAIQTHAVDSGVVCVATLTPLGPFINIYFTATGQASSQTISIKRQAAPKASTNMMARIVP
jgi:hypothetical protein